MANKKISQLGNANTLDGTELVPIVQDGVTLKTTVQDIADLSGGGGGTVDVNTIGSAINGATSATPNDTDLVMSVESSVAKKNTWTQIKAFLKTYFDSIYQPKFTDVENTQTITGTSITLPNTPTFIYGVFMNGQRLTKTTDYTVSTNIITLVDSADSDSFTTIYKY